MRLTQSASAKGEHRSPFLQVTCMSLRDIRERYGVSFERGNRVMCGGRFGTVAGATDSHVRVKFDGRQISSPCDPLEVQPCDPPRATQWTPGSAASIPNAPSA